MTDLINRQDAIDGLLDLPLDYGRYDCASVEDMLMQLPQAQLEIIYCKDCKHLDPIYKDGAGVCGHWNAKTENNVYCSYAERRT